MVGWSRSVGALAVGGILALGVVSPVAAGPPRGGLVDITASRTGQQQLAIALERRAARGQRGSREELRVLRFDAASYLVVPRSLEVVGARTTAERDGGRHLDVDVRVTAPATVAGGTPSSLQAAGPSWQWVVGDCFDALTSAFGYSVSCYELDRVLNDGTSARDYWALEHWSMTGPSFNHGLTPNAKIYDAWVASARAAGSPAMSWIDWSPRSDRSGSCQPVGLSVSVLKLPLGGSYQMCEQWDATWYADGGRFKNQWKCGCIFPFGISGDREVAYMVAVAVPSGTAPSWVLSQGFLAW